VHGDVVYRDDPAPVPPHRPCGRPEVDEPDRSRVDEDGTACASVRRRLWPRACTPVSTFVNLGLCAYGEHAGERPIAITWRLRRSMPATTFRSASVVA
jgi:hypothetical protein